MFFPDPLLHPVAYFVDHLGTLTVYDAMSLNHVIDWDHAKMIDRESNKMDR